MFVYVGSSDTEPYVVHKTFLGSGSSVLRAMMELEFKEKNEGIIRLRVADHDTFDEYVSFLYTGKLTTTNLEAREEIYNAELHRLIDLYVLGDFLQDPSFSDAVIDRIIANTKISIPDKKGTTSDWQLYPFGKVTSAIYNRVPAGSPLRQLLVDQHLAKGTERWLFDKEVEPPINDSLFEKDFLYDLCLALFSKLSDAAKPKSPETFESTCKYHNHDRFGRTCYKTAK